MSYADITIHDVKSVDVLKRENKDKGGNVKFTTLKIEMADKKGERYTLTAFLNDGDEGYNINLV